MKKTKYIFVSGGVISGLGKGITSASISLLLKKQGYKVCPIKCENYLNVDSGTINPIEHGDPFLCHDGLEADQDLGNYERFLEQEVGKPNFMTMGQLYYSVIQKEREMFYGGEDVEAIPHVVNEILDRIKNAAKDSKADFVVIEFGGTVGEYENNNGLYYEAARILAFTEPVAHVHVTYVPVPVHIGEPKTKPAQFGLKDLQNMGISPQFIIVRSELPVDSQRRYKFAFKVNIKPENIYSAENLSDIHKVPIHLHKQGFDRGILKHFGMKYKKIDLKDWENFVHKNEKLKKSKTATKIAIVGKYFGTGDCQLSDSYLALIHALKYASVNQNKNINLQFINSEKQENDIDKLLKDVDGIVVPIGWGTRGVEGKIKAIKFARENRVPYLGLCYGMQLACVEYARHVLNLKKAHSEEVDPKSPHKIIHSIPFNEKYQTIKGKGVSMRLGTFDCVIKKGTKAFDIYKKYEFGTLDNENNLVVQERHRHRYEFNNFYREQFEKSGFIFSGTSPDDFFVEMIELPKDIHPFFIATQAHPEYKTYPMKSHPLFNEFIKSASA